MIPTLEGGRTCLSASPAETQALARVLLDATPGRLVLALHGELGSGKTCFVQGLALALGVRQAVTSPTFTLINTYRTGRRPLVHVDLYRLRGPDEVAALGLDEYDAADTVMAIEWAERAGEWLPPDARHVYFEATPDLRGRVIRYAYE